MGAEGKRYLQDHSIPQLFEGLMTGLIYNKPEDPLDFLEAAIAKIRSNPDLDVKWDTFIDTENGPPILEPSGVFLPYPKQFPGSKKGFVIAIFSLNLVITMPLFTRLFFMR